VIRTHVRLTQEQIRGLRLLAAQKKKSIADLVRQGVELYLSQEAQSGKAYRVQQALQAAGKFSSGTADGSPHHDRHLVDAYRR